MIKWLKKFFIIGDSFKKDDIITRKESNPWDKLELSRILDVGPNDYLIGRVNEPFKDFRFCLPKDKVDRLFKLYNDKK